MAHIWRFNLLLNSSEKMGGNGFDYNNANFFNDI